MKRPFPYILFFFLFVFHIGYGQIWKPISTNKSHQPTFNQYSSQQHEQINRQNHEIVKQHNQIRRTQNQAIIEEIRSDNLPTVNYQFPSKMEKEGAKDFQVAYHQLENMLQMEEEHLSLKEAIFKIEKAFLGDRLNKEWYDKEISDNIEIIKNELKYRGYQYDNELAKKMILHQFMSDTIVVRDEEGNELYKTHPKRYDFEDIHGEKDWTKMFVSKLMFTGTGQCHSMPLLYLVLAEELGIEAYLALSPEHSYIKLKDDKGTWFNLELTNGNYASDSWLLSSGYVKAEAIQNGLYMKPLSKKETIATFLVDLGIGYFHKYGIDEFVLQCAEKSLEYAPNNIAALQLRSNYHTLLFDFVAKQRNYPPQSAFPHYPKLNSMYERFHNLYKEIDDLGYDYMPPVVYKKWLESLNNKKQQTKFPRA